MDRMTIKPRGTALYSKRSLVEDHFYQDSHGALLYLTDSGHVVTFWPCEDGGAALSVDKGASIAWPVRDAGNLTITIDI